MDTNAPKFNPAKQLLPFQWERTGDKNVLFCGPQRVGSYVRAGGFWHVTTLFYSKKIEYTPASEPETREYVQSTCRSELLSMLVDVDELLRDNASSVRRAVVGKIKHGIRFIHTGTAQVPGEYKKAFKENAGDLKSIDAITDYDKKLMKKVDALLESCDRPPPLPHWKQDRHF